ncbi:MAG: hypothetical protein JXA10_16315, partial [Anaerolineae bacterium]|nr:hypothetical protein [Anaerolineae bacterium]
AAGESDRWAYYNAGTAAAASGDYDTAAHYFDQALRFDLPERMLWYQFGPYAAYYHTGRYADVLAITARIQASAPENEDVMAWRGLALAAVGQMADARAELDRAIQFNPNNALAQESRALIARADYAPPAPFRLAAVSIP